MITFVCPGCGHRYRLGDRYFGAKVCCEGCNQRYFIGIRGEGTSDDDLPAVPAMWYPSPRDSVETKNDGTAETGGGIPEAGQVVQVAVTSCCRAPETEDSPDHADSVTSVRSSVYSGSSSSAAMASSGDTSQPWSASDCQEGDSPQLASASGLTSCAALHRLLARSLDFELGYWLLVLSLGMLIAGTSWESRLSSIPVWIDWMLSLPLYYLFEAGMYSWFHTTPGKWLMGVSIVDLNFRPLSSGDYFRRDLLVWLLGCGMGVPILSVFMVCYQSQRLKKDRQTVYDEKLGTQAISKGQTFLKAMVGVSLLGLSLAGRMGLERL